MLRIATRASELALAQANIFATLAATDYELVIAETEGDRRISDSLHEMGGQGVFVKEIQAAIIDGRADVAVHSAKDLPTASTPGLRVGAFLERADPRDVLAGCTLAELPQGARVGTSSVRRGAQLRMIRPDINIVPIRGNIRTRLQRLDDLDAIFVAAAALDRLRINDIPFERLDPELLCPQIGQGAIAIECSSGDTNALDILSRVNHAATEAEVLAERALLAAFGTGCSLPIGGYAKWGNGELTLQGVVASVDGRTLLKASANGSDPVETGTRVAESLLARGAMTLLD